MSALTALSSANVFMIPLGAHQALGEHAGETGVEIPKWVRDAHRRHG